MKPLTCAERMYFLCQERGHHEFRGGIVFDTNPPFYTCSDCGTTFQELKTIHEGHTPFGWIGEPGVAHKIKAARVQFDALIQGEQVPLSRTPPIDSQGEKTEN